MKPDELDRKIRNSSEKAAPEEKLLVFLLLSMIVGVILACLFEALSLRGVFQRCEIVSRVPENTIAVVGGLPMQVVIRTSENMILSCSLSNSDECWIPNVHTEDPFYTKACDEEHVAFSSAHKPPQNITSCIEINTSGGGYSYDVIYIIDRAGNLWQWANVREGNETPLFLIMMMPGALGGILIGSIIWIIIRIARKNRNSPGNPLFSKTHIVLLAVPWLCLLSFLLLRFLPINRTFRSLSSRTSAVHSAMTETAIVRQTLEAEEWLVQVTPGIGNVRYSFSEHSCDANWSSGREDILCLFSFVSSGETNAIGNQDVVWIMARIEK